MNITPPQFGNYRFHSGEVDYAKLQSSTAQSATTDTSSSNAPTSIAPVDATPVVATPAFDSAALAKSILSFVQQRLSKEAQQGASKEQLSALLAQAQEGVTTGFKQAAAELKNSGALTDTISSGISSALQKVDSGLDDLAQQFGLTSTPAASSTATTAGTTTTTTSPSTASNSTSTPSTTAPSSTSASSSSTPVATQTNATSTSQTNTLAQLVSAYNVKFSNKQSIDLLVKTADGDTVHIQLGVKDKLSFNAGNQANANGQQAVSAGEKSGARLNISVDGNLDAGELQALGDLLNKVGDLANSFFSGDINGALQQATALNFASPELSSLSLDLRSSVSVRAKVATYAAVQSLANSPSTDGSAASVDNTTNSAAPTTSTPSSLQSTDLADALTSLLPKASLADNPASLLKQLLAAQIGAINLQNNPLLEFANRLLDALGAATSSQTPTSTPDTTTPNTTTPNTTTTPATTITPSTITAPATATTPAAAATTKTST